MAKTKIENKPAEAYAKPHGEAFNKPFTESVNCMDKLKISVGGISKSQNDKVKTDGIKQRGSGAATKGFISRGPMA
jgi:hypothetical protein